MKKLGKVLAVAMASAMVFSLAACGGSASTTTTAAAAATTKAAAATTAAAAATTKAAAATTAAAAAATTKAAAAATTAADKEANSKYTVAVVLKTLSSEYWNYVKAGCDQASKDLGVKVTVVGPGAESEIAEQVSMIEQQLAQGVSAIVCAPNDASSAAAALQKFVDKKTPVVFVDTDADLAGKTSFVGTGNEDAAGLGGKYVVDKLGKGGKVAIIYGQEGEGTSNARKSGFEKALKDGGMDIVAEQSGNNTTDGALAAMEALLNAHPDVKAVCCHNDDTALGVLKACQNANVKDMLIVGFDGNKTAVQSIIDGGMTATVAQQPYNMGYQAVQTALQAAKGEKVEAKIKVDAKLVSKDNAQTYLDDLAKLLK